MNNRNKEILEDFKTSMDGLTTKEAAKRLEKYGYNELPKEEIKPLYKVFLGSFKAGAESNGTGLTVKRLASTASTGSPEAVLAETVHS